MVGRVAATQQARPRCAARTPPSSRAVDDHVGLLRRVTLELGGKSASVVLEDGHYVAPTVFSRVDPDSRPAQEGVFGPVLSILAADSDGDASGIGREIGEYGIADVLEVRSVQL